MTTPSQAEDRYVPFPGPKGLVPAVATVLLAAALVFGAYSIHKATYKPPTDPTNLDGVTTQSQ
jgi:hypothetical protein